MLLCLLLLILDADNQHEWEGINVLIQYLIQKVLLKKECIDLSGCDLYKAIETNSDFGRIEIRKEKALTFQISTSTII